MFYSLISNKLWENNLYIVTVVNMFKTLLSQWSSTSSETIRPQTTQKVPSTIAVIILSMLLRRIKVQWRTVIQKISFDQFLQKGNYRTTRGSFNLKPYSTASCNVIVMYEKNAIGLVETENVKSKPNPNSNLNPSHSPKVALMLS